MWEYAQAAAHKKEQLPDEFSRARDAANGPVEVFLTYRHGATGVEHEQKRMFLTEFSSSGELCVSESYTERLDR